jgi:transcription antitermination factor NusA-like protein
MEEFIKYAGVTSGIVFLLIIIVFNADNISLVFSFLLKPFTFIKFIRKSKIAFEYQGKINEVCGRIASNIFDRKLKIKWISQKAINEKPYSLSEEDEIIVYVHHQKNSNQVIIDVLHDYVSLTLCPNIKHTLDQTFAKSNQLFITNKIVDEYKNQTLTHLYKNNYFGKQLDDKTKEYLTQIQIMHDKNYYFKVFLDALKQVDEKYVSISFDNEMGKETLSFFNFILNVSQKERDEKVDLTFTGKYLKYSIILVAKDDTLSTQGLDAHISRIKDCRNQLVNRIYISGYGHKNIINVKKITHIVKKLNGLNIIFEGDYEIAMSNGKLKPFRLVVADNTLLSSRAKESDDKNEVIKLLGTYIPEINSGKIEIISVAREKGYGTKILVRATEENVRPVGYCVGVQGERKNVLSEKLNNEMVHFVEQSDDIKLVIKDALFPLPVTAIIEIFIKSQKKSAIVIVKDDEVGRAVGKYGINVGLVEELTGWEIDIKKESASLHITRASIATASSMRSN